MKTSILAFVVIFLFILWAFAPIAAAGNHSHAGDRRAEVATRPPAIDALDFTSSDDEPGEPGVQVHPSAGTTKGITLAVTAQDGNGHNDIQGVTVSVYKPDNVTVHIGATPASKASGTGKQAVYEALFAMQFHDPPGTYHIETKATDRDGSEATAWGTFVYAEISAVAVGEETISLNPDGSSETAVSPGDDTRANPNIVTITNVGNVPINAELSGTDLQNADASESIGVGNVKYDLASDFSSESSLATAASTLTLNLSPGASSSADVYFAIVVPDATPAGTYTGTATVSAVKAA